MGKARTAHTIQGRHIYARASYLYQAANYLASRAHTEQRDDNQTAGGDGSPREHGQVSTQQKLLSNLSRQAISDMRAVTLKAQIRQSPSIKKTVCRYCDTLLVEGSTSLSFVENQSKGGKKPWADVLVVQCKTCGKAKRYPVSAPRQPRRPLRVKQLPAQEVGETIENIEPPSATS
ncbi:hypothetical protein S7711_00531 [Stachybotrys chartarum IBT 7711]|uniref:Uncharacterized protein n=1 Tax=Stachybotrys chartarum (strain CBS 109288 / IBT 7711) TaxID=1280523 RepID=A0A084ATM3_STACB|nr:hypothetical protein S7711_00531 [Stachybotrys chartarum IBT 7711]KFA49703.1 hypothetical protein S40293_01377 [Stachybotrys chartarum IBT 40293]